MNNLKRLAITCGGTGGHFYPGLGTARRAVALEIECRLFLSGIHSARQRSISESCGINATALPVMPPPRRNPLKFIAGLSSGFFRTCRDFKAFRPDALLAMGSFASLPAVLAAKVCGIPVFLHDGNAKIGKANRFLSRFAVFTATAFPAVNRNTLRCRYLETGMPLRPEIADNIPLPKTDAVDYINRRYNACFSHDIPVLLITGGSQGAAVFAEIMPAALKRFQTGLQVIHLAGPGKEEQCVSAYIGCGLPKLILPYCERMDVLFSAADLVISRSGGSSVAELIRFGKAAVLIPYPSAAEAHQEFNARYLSDAGAAVTVLTDDFTEQAAANLLYRFTERREEFSGMGKKAAALYRPDASGRLLAEIDAALAG